MVIVVKCWIENAYVANGLFLILKISDIACQLKFFKKKMPTQIKNNNNNNNF
jgi:hypothetical protein